MFRRFQATSFSKKNQFGLGDMNFNMLACFLVTIPLCVYFYCSVARRLINPETEVSGQRKLTSVANTAGIAGVLALSFFLIPVSRHSVLLVALGWSPVHALRLHVWAGFTSFFFISIHAISYVIDWFAFHEESVWEQIIPDSECWEWRTSEVTRSCNHQWYNFSGIIAGVLFVVLIISSLNWFRRKYYSIFYFCHVVFGTAMLLMAILHWRPLVTYLMPSIIYYMASTTPTLVQAAASYFRGGVKVHKVLQLVDAGGCLEVQMATTGSANAALDRETCLFVKICVPKHSLVWHPFTVFKATSDPSTVRFIFRPVGPFTTKLAHSILENTRPRIIVDGFYRGGDRAHEALQHDHVTIVAGGVAITPFLSMIPSLLSKVETNAKNEGSSVAVTLHWTVREQGLMIHIRSMYLQGFVDTANKVGVEFHVHIHFTGHDKGITSENLLKEPVEDVAAELSEEVSTESHTQEQEESNESPSERSVATPEETSGSSGAHKGTHGVAMEVARIMPGRQTYVLRNFPLFFAFSSTVWLCYRIIFGWYQFREYEINAIYARVFGTAVAMCVALGMAIAVEMASLFMGSYFTEPFTEPARVETGPPTAVDGLVGMETGGSAQIEMHHGRPAPEILLADAYLAQAPGIFMCGPSGLTTGVRKLAAKENSMVGLTRYCLYEEPFEM